MNNLFVRTAELQRTLTGTTLPEAGHPKGKVVETTSPADQQADSEEQRDR